MMMEAIGCEDSRKGESLLGLLGYYEAILERKGLETRIGEIRSLKLGLTLDLLKTIGIGEELKAKLITSVVSAWKMSGNDDMPVNGEGEMKTMRKSIASIRKNAQIAVNKCNPRDQMQLDVSVMFALPLMSSDLKNDEVPIVSDLLNEIMAGFAERSNQGFVPCP
jgi:hypothetical protein